jgi:hypothetical protein
MFFLPDYQTIDVKTTDRTSIKISGRKSTKTFRGKNQQIVYMPVAAKRALSKELITAYKRGTLGGFLPGVQPMTI